MTLHDRRAPRDAHSTWAVLAALGLPGLGAVAVVACGAGTPPVQNPSSSGATSAAAGAPSGAAPSTGTAGVCPPAWTAPLPADPSIAVPAGEGSVVLHVAASGTQDYACKPAPDGGIAWAGVGPEADLHDCNGATVGHHFASATGAAAPAWEITGQGTVIAKKTAAVSPAGGAPAVPWLLLQATRGADAGVLARATYVQRVRTAGGVAPSAPCTSNAGVTKVPYTADYYFYAK